MANLPAAMLGRQPSSRMRAWSISSAEPLFPGGGGWARYLVRMSFMSDHVDWVRAR